jgi:photosystem II stability/assembly factor-like uncharacterized protein
MATSTATPTATAPALPYVPSPAIVRIDMLDGMKGWAIADTYVLRTEDGGATWLNATPAGVTTVGFSAVSFFLNTSTAWVTLPGVVPTNGTLYRTNDGGFTWTSYSAPFSSGALQFLDANNGTMLAALGAGAGSEAVAAFKTADGGMSWTQVYTNDPTAFGSSNTLPLVGQKSGMTFLDANRGWVGGSEPLDGFIYLYSTGDGGVSWVQQPLILPGGFETSMTGVDAPIFFSPTDGILYVNLFAAIPSTAFYVTFDGGTTWAHTFAVNATGRYSYASLLDVFLWDGGPSLLVSHDSGLTWASVAPNINVIDTLMQIDFVNATTGWVLTGDTSNHYSLYKTTDGGETWTQFIP